MGIFQAKGFIDLTYHTVRAFSAVAVDAASAAAGIVCAGEHGGERKPLRFRTEMQPKLWRCRKVTGGEGEKGDEGAQLYDGRWKKTVNLVLRRWV